MMNTWKAVLVYVFIFAHSAISYDIEEEQVTFYLRNRETDVEVQLTIQNLNLVNSSKSIHVLIHGWVSAHNTSWFTEATDAYLSVGDYNIIQVDWSEPANQEYDVSANNTKAVGQFVGKLISKLVKENAVPASNIHLIGHSFGAHVAGFAGKTINAETNSKIKQITALDPARRPFENDSVSQEDRLYKGDAQVVVALHTDGGGTGYLGPLGTMDFFPDGGSAIQPGCETSDIDWCSHVIVTDYFIESITNPNGFLSTKCGSYEEYKAGACGNNKKISLGGQLNPEDEGEYFLQTNNQKPYSKE